MPPRVLVVEDDADGRDPLTELLALEGYEATCAADGPSAVMQLASERYDILVLDLGLPDHPSGLEIIRAARASSAPPAVVVFTGHHRLKADAEAAGCDAFVLKPDLDELLARLKSTVAARRETAGPERKRRG